jgi:glycosyltransferase involved in cell wall biosynthesis
VPDLSVDFEILKRHRQADVVYAATGGLLLVPILRRLGFFRPRVLTWAFAPPRRAPWWKLRGLEFSKATLRGYDGVLCLTKKAEAWFRPRCPRAVVRTIDWGADLDLFAGGDASSKGAFFFANGRTLRDYPTLIEACRDGDFQVRVIAPRASVAGCDIPANVQFMEGSSNPPDAAISYPELRQWYAGSIAVLIPLFDDSDDTCGLTNLVEAMAMGRPIIKTRSGCLDLDVEKLGIGLHVAPGDVQGWRKAIHFIRANPQQAEAMGQRGLELARRHYNARQFGDRVAGLMKEVLG